MTRVNTEQTKHTPWFAKAGAACSIVPIARFVGPEIFALKGGGYGCLFALTGIDEEGLTDQELESRMRSIEGSLRGLPEGSCLYQYTRVMSGFDLPRQPKYANPATEVFASDRLTFLEKTAGFRRIDLHWCLTLEPSKVKAFERKPQENAADTSRMVADLEKTATILQSHLGSAIGLRLLGKDETFQFFSYLFNLEEWAERDQLRSDTGVDRQIVKTPVAWHSDHLQVGKRHVQMFSLKTTPEASRPCLFSGLLTVDCDSVLCSTWRVKSTSSARSEIDAQEKFISFFKVGVLSGNKKAAPASAMTMRPASPNAQQVNSFSTQQQVQAQRDAEERQHQQELAAAMQQLQAEQSVPGPEAAGTQPMTAAQRDAIYGNSPNAPQHTSNISQAHAEAKQKQLAKEKQEQDAINSNTVAIDFAHAGAAPGAVVPSQPATAVLAEREEAHPQTVTETPTSPSPTGASDKPGVVQVPSAQLAKAVSKADPMAGYDFDNYQGRLYRVFEGTVFEGVVTNHIDGGLSGPILVMLTTDYYSHDHQQLLMPQGTRLIGTVQSVGNAQQRKMFVTFHRAVCPDGFSLDFDKYIGLDPLGTTGLATKVDHGYRGSPLQVTQLLEDVWDFVRFSLTYRKFASDNCLRG